MKQTTSEDTDEIVKAQERAHYLLVRLHDDVDSGAYAFVHKLCGER